MIHPFVKPKVCDVLLNGNLVKWKSKKQRIVSTSSAETDFIAVAEAIEDTIEIRQNHIDLEMT